jgi:hypothetical protein
VLKTVYCFVWDVEKDWNLYLFGFFNGTLISKRNGRTRFQERYYYIAVILDLIGRGIWTAAISPEIIPPRFGLLLAFIEICRRAMWNVLRVEKQQIHMEEKMGKEDSWQVKVELALASQTEGTSRAPF